MTDDLVGAVDLGGTKIAAAAVDGDGRVRRRALAATPAADGPTAILTTVERLVREVGPVAAVGVGSAGVIDATRGVVVSATDALPGWVGTDVRGQLQHRMGLAVAVDNDVHAHALGERWTGAARVEGPALVVTVGTGIGGSWIVGKHPEHGAHGVAGHLGHMPCLTAGDRRCPCGGRGHLEAFASGPALAAEYSARTGAPSRPLKEVAGAARRGDAEAAAVLAEGGAAVGAVLGGLINLLDPQVVVIGGGVACSGATWWEPLCSAVESQLLPALVDVSVVPSQLAGDSALVGAASLAWDLVR